MLILHNVQVVRSIVVIFTFLCVGGATSSITLGVPLYSEDFEGYADQPAFEADWSPLGSPPHLLDTTFGNASQQSLQLNSQPGGSGVSNRWYQTLATPILPSDAKPLVFSFDFYLDPLGSRNSWSSDWQTVGVRAYSGGGIGSGSLSGIVAMGVSRLSSLDADIHNNAFFQGRIFTFGHTSQTYYSLDALPTATGRSSGWHRLEAQIGATQTLFLVDGQPAEMVNVGITAPINTIVLGSDLTTSQPYWVDNLRLEVVPEPNTFMVTCAFAFGLIWRRRSQRMLFK